MKYLLALLLLIPVWANAAEFHDDQFGPWEAMTHRLDQETDCTQGKHFCTPKSWDLVIVGMKGMDLLGKLDVANKAINLRYPYAVVNSHKWATPMELDANKRGDCKDHAIAKMALLNAAGVPSDDMKVVVLHNNIGHYLHAILLVDGHILDDQTNVIETNVPYYEPIYAINFNGWWLY